MSRWGRALALGAVLAQAAAPAGAESPGDPAHTEAATPAEDDAVTAPERWVFLVHGILLSKGSMAYLEERLRAAGFRVVNRSYPSTRLTIQESADFLRRRIARRTDANPDIEVNLVTHSMGGLVARYYLTHTPPPRVGALVQIAPPNRGSEKATYYKNFFFYRWVYRKPGQQLLTGMEDFHRELGTPRGRIGIIAGGTGDEYGFSPGIRGDDDGTISVENTKLATMTDHIVLRYSHAFIMRKRETADQVIQFLRRGRFAHPAPGPATDHTIAAVE